MDSATELGYPVRNHRLVAGRVEGLDPHRDEKMEAAMATFRKGVVEYGAEDQMLDFVKNPGGGTGTKRSTVGTVVNADARGDPGDNHSPRKPSSTSETSPKAETPAMAKRPKRSPPDSGVRRTPHSRARTPRGAKGIEKKAVVAGTPPRVARTPRSRGAGGGKAAEQPKVKTPGVRARDVSGSGRNAQSEDAEEFAASYVRETFRISRNGQENAVPEGSAMGAGERGEKDGHGEGGMSKDEEESTTEPSGEYRGSGADQTSDAGLAASNPSGKSQGARIRSPEGKRGNPGTDSENVGKVPCETTVENGRGKRTKGSPAGSPKGAKRSREKKLAEAPVVVEGHKGVQKKRRASTGELARGEQGDGDGDGGGDEDEDDQRRPKAKVDRRASRGTSRKQRVVASCPSDASDKVSSEACEGSSERRIAPFEILDATTPSRSESPSG